MTSKPVAGLQFTHGLTHQKTYQTTISVSLARLRSTEKRLAKMGCEYAEAYRHQIHDMVSRGVARNLTNEEIEKYQGPTSVWQKGPKYLTLPVDQWPIRQPHMQKLPDRNSTSFSCKVENNQPTDSFLVDIGSFSSYEKLIKTTAIVLSICKKKTFNSILQGITSENLKKAEHYWVKIVQSEFINWEKIFTRLGSSKDENDIIVVGEKKNSKWLKDT